MRKFDLIFADTLRNIEFSDKPSKINVVFDQCKCTLNAINSYFPAVILCSHVELDGRNDTSVSFEHAKNLHSFVVNSGGEEIEIDGNAGLVERSDGTRLG